MEVQAGKEKEWPEAMSYLTDSLVYQFMGLFLMSVIAINLKVQNPLAFCPDKLLDSGRYETKARAYL